jgi:hypothetical protein
MILTYHWLLKNDLNSANIDIKITLAKKKLLHLFPDMGIQFLSDADPEDMPMV